MSGQFRTSRFRPAVLLLCLTPTVAFGWRGVPVAASRPQSAGQSTAPADQQPATPTFRTGANFVRVDLYPLLNSVPVQDLRQDECEILEDGRPQKIETFDHIVVRTGGSQSERIEPNTVAQSRQMAAEARSRVFVIFLDFNFVDVGGSHAIRQPLIDMLDRAIGSDDLVAVMTPEMAATQITFARRTGTIEGMLSRYWTWGERDQINSKDPIEDEYRMCYPGLGPTSRCPDDDRGVADEMIERRREKQTLDALGDLVRYLRTVREERKAILAISDGWLLFHPNDALARRLYCQAPTGPPVGIDPGTGKLTTRPPQGAVRSGTCDRDRMALSQMDDERDFRTILEEANRSNCTFYPVDPRGLAVFDSSLADHRTGNPPPGSTTLVAPSTDLSRLRDRIVGAHRRRYDFVLPDQLLLDRPAGRQIPLEGEGGTIGVRLLGRNGTPIPLPIQTGEDRSSGTRTIAGELALAPLAASDYVLEIVMTGNGQQQRVLAPFRIVPW